MSKLIPNTITLALLLVWSLSAHAIPILSSDGSLLSGVDVDGVLYDISFGDGIYAEVYDLAVIGTSEWYPLSEAISGAVVTALNSLDSVVLPNDIAGCEDIYTCYISLPDEWWSTSLLRDGGPIEFQVPIIPCGLGCPPSIGDVEDGHWIKNGYAIGYILDPTDDTTGGDTTTLMTYSLSAASPIPAPGIVWLIMTALIALGFARIKLSVDVTT